jgi:ribosomal protein S18 acetylase RimI-like enzyme
MEIRKIAPEELDEVARLFVSAYGEDWTAEQARRYLEKFYRFEPEACLVAFEPHGRLAGAIFGYSYYRKDQLVLFIQEIFVHPQFRHQGLGRALVQALRGTFTEKPETKITPLVNAPPSVLSFYNSLGFNREQAFTFYDG